MGRYTKQKKSNHYFKSCSNFKKTLNFRLLILGEGSEKNMQKFIEDNNLKNYVKLKDFIDNPFRLIKESDIFILSSKYKVYQMSY